MYLVSLCFKINLLKSTISYINLPTYKSPLFNYNKKLTTSEQTVTVSHCINLLRSTDQDSWALIIITSYVTTYESLYAEL